MNVALYARVSMDELNDPREQDPENQLRPLRDYAKSMNYQIVGEYVDRAKGDDPNRPHLQALIEQCKNGKITMILVWKLDRISRFDAASAVVLFQRLRDEYGVGVKSYTESWADTSIDNPASSLIIFVLSWASNLEKKKIAERTEAGIDNRVRQDQLRVAELTGKPIEEIANNWKQYRQTLPRPERKWKGGRPVGAKDKKPRTIKPKKDRVDSILQRVMD